MNFTQGQRKLLDMLAKNEEKISALYKIFAEEFPEYRKFWIDLANQEIQHYLWLKGLGDQVADGAIFINENRFPLKAVELFSSYLEEIIKKTKDGKLSFKNAVSIARDIENALVERDFFKIFSGDSPRLKDILSKLEIETREHGVRIQSLFDSITG